MTHIFFKLVILYKTGILIWKISRPGCQICLFLFGVESVHDRYLNCPNIVIILQLEY